MTEQDTRAAALIAKNTAGTDGAATILVADDEQNNLRTILDYLRGAEMKYKILNATNGRIACQIAEQRQPDLIIMDWEMPEMTGIEAIRHLKSIPATTNIPIIMASGIMVSSEHLRLALDAGAIDYIRKPIDKIELLARIQSILALSESYKKIEQQKEELAELNGIKDKLFSVISHDLRGPLSSIQSFLTLLNMEGAITPEQVKRFTEKLAQDVKVTQILLDNLLNWARAQMKGITVKPKNLSLLTMAEEIKLLYQMECENKQLSTIIEIPENARVFADRDMAMLVLRNLFSNAIKFTPEQGSITISAEQQNGFAHVKVRDTGVGMPADKLEALFDMNRNNSTLGTKKEVGTGLGLILSKEFVEKNGGSLVVESKENEGTTFSFTLPVPA